MARFNPLPSLATLTLLLLPLVAPGSGDGTASNAELGDLSSGRGGLSAIGPVYELPRPTILEAPDATAWTEKTELAAGIRRLDDSGALRIGTAEARFDKSEEAGEGAGDRTLAQSPTGIVCSCGH